MADENTKAGPEEQLTDSNPDSTKPCGQPLVIIESPFKPKLTKETRLPATFYRTYLRRAILHCIDQGEVPFASHGFYTVFLNDKKPEERALGMRLGYEIMAHASLVAVYYDYGLTPGMQRGIEVASDLNIPVRFRSIGRNEAP